MQTCSVSIPKFPTKTRRPACPEFVTQAAVSVFSLTSTAGNETSDHISMPSIKVSGRVWSACGNNPTFGTPGSKQKITVFSASADRPQLLSFTVIQARYELGEVVGGFGSESAVQRFLLSYHHPLCRSFVELCLLAEKAYRVLVFTLWSVQCLSA